MTQQQLENFKRRQANLEQSLPGYTVYRGTKPVYRVEKTHYREAVAFIALCFVAALAFTWIWWEVLGKV